MSEPDRDDLPDLLASPPSFDDPEAVVSFVEAYEIAYMWEGWSDYGEEVPEFHVAMALEVVKTRDNGAIVQSDYSRAHGKADHNGDGTAGHFDGGRYAFRYLVTTDAVWRVAEKKEPYGPVPELDVREEGEVLVCFREGETP